MSAQQPAADHRRFRLATNDNETIIVVDDEQDTEGHRLATNDNETIVPNLRRFDDGGDDDEPAASDARRGRRLRR